MGLDYNGNMRVKASTKTVMHEQESTFSGSTGSEEIASKDIVGKDYSIQDLEWSITGTGILDNSDGGGQVDAKILLDAWKAKEKFPVEMTDDVNGNVAISGTGFYENVSIKSNNKQKVTFDFTIKGIGEPDFDLNA